MSKQIPDDRARSEAARGSGGPEVYRRVLGHPLAFLATAAILLALFGGTFVFEEDRVAPTKDPAYYTWRTETLISEDPETLLSIEGAYEMFSGGYRVSAAVIGGYLRRIPAVSSLNSTALLMVLIPVLTALLVAGFAYRHRRDPLIFHSVAFGVASLYLTPPFVGYLDNVLCLLFLAAAIWFIGPARTTWPGRAGLFLFLLLTGFAHPTTLVIFCLTLGAIAAARLLFRRFDLRSVIRDDGPMLLTGFGAAVATLAIWTIGIWGRKASLAEAALPPPYDSDFFLERMSQWVSEMTPILNGPLFAIGVIGLLVAGRKWVEDELTTVSIIWLAPLAGLFGFVGGLTYPYYRFFNTTVAWVLLIGLGGYFLIRFLIDAASRGGPWIAGPIVAAVGVGAIFGLNFVKGFDSSHWNDPAKGWLSSDERRDLDAVRAALAIEANPGAAEGFRGGADGAPAEGEDRPVVFVIDSEDTSFQVWGDTKLAGNTSRYGLPHEQIDQAFLYLGSLENFLRDEPTFVDDQPTVSEECSIEELGDNTYNCLSFALLEDTRAGIERAGREPVVVVPKIFNPSGANADLAAGATDAALPSTGDAQVWLVNEGQITGSQAVNRTGPVLEFSTPSDEDAGLGHLLRVVVLLLLLLIPGAIALRFFLPGASFAEAVAMAPALALALLTVVGIAVLAVTRTPFSTSVAWISVLVTLAGAVFVAWRASNSPASSRSAPTP